jgi:hypothetical protein
MLTRSELEMKRLRGIESAAAAIIEEIDRGRYVTGAGAWFDVAARIAPLRLALAPLAAEPPPPGAAAKVHAALDILATMPAPAQATPSAEADELAAKRRAQLDKEAREALRMTAAAPASRHERPSALDFARQMAEYLLEELDWAKRLRVEVAIVAGQRDYIQGKVSVLADQLYELGTAPPDEKECANSACPVGCPDSHAVDFGQLDAAHDAEGARERIAALQGIHKAALLMTTILRVARGSSVEQLLANESFKQAMATIEAGL